MIAALRLWWLLRSICGPRRDLAVATSFGLLTWATLTAVGLLTLVGRADAVDGRLVGSIVVLVGALALTSVVSARSLLRGTRDARLAALRTTGASRLQTGLIGALDVAEAALPGVVLGVLADAAEAWFLARTGTDLVPSAPWILVPVVALAGVLALIVAHRVRAAEEPRPRGASGHSADPPVPVPCRPL
ncbi:hypothetical protein [Mobilicoccus sp.]|uniref:hypothetical protein n=1 Tax=Mobilicoccus sp. TaxID=2034349 RepID=UPI00289ED1E4|nr:hypothetical protein [Mobilicoccus sp.]